MSPLPIGGFFPLELSEGTGGVLGAWSADRPFACFSNARSALASLIAAETPRAVWLPAFCCMALAQAVPAGLRRYYPVGTALTPDVTALAAVRSGEMIVGVNYFGRRPDGAFLDYVRVREDVLFVEDCAQDLTADSAGWGDWRLFSPRKLLGVADGGVLVGAKPGRPTPQPGRAAKAPERQWRAALMRFEDEAQDHADLWHPANQEHEAAMSVSDTAMTRLSRRVLKRVDPAPLIERRRANFACLEALLAGLQLRLFHRATDVPFAFPLRLDRNRRDAVLAQLHAERILAAVHWRELPSPPEAFPDEHRLAGELISLPCDHRYGADDMARMAEVVLRVAT